jgi:hypothetical protein
VFSFCRVGRTPPHTDSIAQQFSRIPATLGLDADKNRAIRQCIQEIRSCRRCAGAETGQHKVAACPILSYFPKKDDVPFRSIPGKGWSARPDVLFCL